jgi:hypothetical protein
MAETLVITEQPKYKLTVSDGNRLTLVYGVVNVPTLGSMAFQDADDVDITGGSLSDMTNITTNNATVSGTLNADHIHGNLAGSLYAHVRAGENLAKGDPVYISGSQGTGANLVAVVSKARADDPTKMPAVGIMDAAVSNNADGHMVIKGNITGLNTNDYDINDTLYVGATGGFTDDPFTVGGLVQAIARVERKQSNNGAILVKVNGLGSTEGTAETLVYRDSTGSTTQNTVYISGSYYGNRVGISAGDVTESDIFQLPAVSPNTGGVGPSTNGTFLVRNNDTNDVVGGGNIGDDLSLPHNLKVSELTLLPDPLSGGSNEITISQYNTARTIEADKLIEYSSVMSSGGVAYATGTDDITTDTTNFAYDAANNRLLLNSTNTITSPQEALHIRSGNIYAENTGGPCAFILNRTDGASLSVSGAANGAIRLEQDKDLLFQTQPKSDINAANASNLTTFLTISPVGSPPTSTDCIFSLPSNLTFDTTTGVKIGTGTSQKIAFWNKTPVVQPTTGVAEATFVANAGGTAVTDDSTFDGYTIQQVVRALRNIGLLA